MSEPQEKKIYIWANCLLFVQFTIIWYITPVLLVIFSVMQIKVWYSGHWEKSNLPILCLILATLLFSLGVYLIFEFLYRRFGFFQAIIFLLVFDILHSLVWLVLEFPLTTYRLLFPMLFCILLLIKKKDLDHQAYILRWGYFRPSEGSQLTVKKTIKLLSLAFQLFIGAVFIGIIGISNLLNILSAYDFRQLCDREFSQILVAMHNYQDQYGTLPPAYTTDSQGRRLHSWRVLLLPYFKEYDNEVSVYNKIKMDEPWNSEWNSQFHKEHMIYHCLSSGGCSCSVVTGPNTFFPGSVSTKLREEDSNKILIVERSQSFCWMDPDQDIDLQAVKNPINQIPEGIGSKHLNRGAHIGMADGTVRFQNGSIKMEDFIRNE